MKETDTREGGIFSSYSSYFIFCRTQTVSYPRRRRLGLYECFSRPYESAIIGCWILFLLSCPQTSQSLVVHTSQTVNGLKLRIFVKVAEEEPVIMGCWMLFPTVSSSDPSLKVPTRNAFQGHTQEQSVKFSWGVFLKFRLGTDGRFVTPPPRSWICLWQYPWRIKINLMQSMYFGAGMIVDCGPPQFTLLAYPSPPLSSSFYYYYYLFNYFSYGSLFGYLYLGFGVLEYRNRRVIMLLYSFYFSPYFLVFRWTF